MHWKDVLWKLVIFHMKSCSCYTRSEKGCATSCLLYTTLFCIYARDCFHGLNMQPPFKIKCKASSFPCESWKRLSHENGQVLSLFLLGLFISSACYFICLCYYIVLVNYIPSSSEGGITESFFTHLRTSMNFLLKF